MKYLKLRKFKFSNLFLKKVIKICNVLYYFNELGYMNMSIIFILGCKASFYAKKLCSRVMSLIAPILIL
jgi:hypothetical protein